MFVELFVLGDGSGKQKVLVNKGFITLIQPCETGCLVRLGNGAEIEATNRFAEIKLLLLQP